MKVRVIGVSGDGERVLGEYELRHMRTIPGPAAW